MTSDRRPTAFLQSRSYSFTTQPTQLTDIQIHIDSILLTFAYVHMCSNMFYVDCNAHVRNTGMLLCKYNYYLEHCFTYQHCDLTPEKI